MNIIFIIYCNILGLKILFSILVAITSVYEIIQTEDNLQSLVSKEVQGRVLCNLKEITIKVEWP